VPQSTFNAVDYKGSGLLTGEYLQYLWGLMTPEEQAEYMRSMDSSQPPVLPESASLPDFLALVLNGKSAAALTPDDVSNSTLRNECWYEVSERARDVRIQKAISMAVAQCHHVLLGSALQNALADQGVALGSTDAEGEEQQSTTNMNMDSVQVLDGEPDAQDEDEDEEGDDEDEDEDEEDGDMLEEALDAEGMVEDGLADMEVDTGEEGSDPLEDASAQLKIITSHFQVLGGTTKTLNLRWPGTFGGLVKFGALFNIDVFQIMSLDCISRFNLYSKVDAWLAVPICIFVGMFLLYQVLVNTNLIEKIMPKEQFRTLIWSKVMLLLFLIYPGLCTILLSVFKCREIEGKYWMIDDLSLQCYTDDWTSQACVSFLGIIFFPIGVPVWCYTLLARNRHKLFTDDKFSARFGFIYQRYEQKYWFWETTEMLRKFTLCGVIIFIESGTMLQLCFSIAVGAFFLAIHFKYQPFDDDLDDNLQTSALTASFLTLVVTVLIKERAIIQTYDPTASLDLPPSTTAFLMLVNFMVLATALYALVKDTIPSIIEEYMAYWDTAVKVKQVMEAAQKEHEAALEAASLAVAAAAAATSGGAAAAATTGVFEKGEPETPKKADLSKDDMSKDHNDEAEDVDTELDKHISRLFLRYDLDGSGTINSFDELEQLCCNLGYRLELDLNPTRIDSIIAEVKAASPNIEWDEAHFSKWFKKTFIENPTQ